VKSMGRGGNCIYEMRFRIFPRLVLLTVLTSGCQLIGGSDPPSPTPGAVRGVVYQGSLTMDGGSISGGLEIIRSGGRVRGALQTTSGLVADGQGQSRGRILTLELSYGGDCPGVMVLEGEWDEDAERFQGTVTAVDCTGTASGTFSFASGESPQW
jgi:hypothetical protein